MYDVRADGSLSNIKWAFLPLPPSSRHEERHQSLGIIVAKAYRHLHLAVAAIMTLLPHTRQKIINKCTNKIPAPPLLSSCTYVCAPIHPPRFCAIVAATRQPQGLGGTALPLHPRRPHAPNRPRAVPPGPVHEGPELPRANSRGEAGGQEGRGKRESTSTCGSNSSNSRFQRCGRSSTSEQARRPRHPWRKTWARRVWWRR